VVTVLHGCSGVGSNQALSADCLNACRDLAGKMRQDQPFELRTYSGVAHDFDTRGKTT
jgi:hypothetical protein